MAKRNNGMHGGTVKWFNASKGYGFIRQEKGPDVFVHHSAIIMEGYRVLDAGEEVTFELEINKETGRTQAANVRKV